MHFILQKCHLQQNLFKYSNFALYKYELLFLSFDLTMLVGGLSWGGKGVAEGGALLNGITCPPGQKLLYLFIYYFKEALFSYFLSAWSLTVHKSQICLNVC